MQKKSNLFSILLIVAAICYSSPLLAQFNGGNVSSPYSMFGIGDTRFAGTATSRSMGGVGYAMRNPISANIINPASNSSIPRYTFFFAMGAEGINNYLSTDKSSTSKNGANLSYVALRMPIARGLGFSFSMTPYSSVGYSMRIVDQRDDVVENIGSVNYLYSGVGDISQYKIGLGWEVFKGFSVGANFIYYLGTLDRNVDVEITPHVSTASYAEIYKKASQTYNKPSVELGLQYMFSLGGEKTLTLGAVYQPHINSTVDMRYLVESFSDGKGGLDTLHNVTAKEGFAFPQKLAGGVAYNSERLSLSLDYSNERFSKSFSGSMLEQKVGFRDKHTFAFGAEYTPEKFDIRSYAKRISYRAGFRYSNTYYTYNGYGMNEYAISAGVGLPFNSQVFSSVNVGIEYAMRGTTKNGLIKNSIVSFFVDVNLFTDQQWFRRYKFD